MDNHFLDHLTCMHNETILIPLGPHNFIEPGINANNWRPLTFMTEIRISLSARRAGYLKPMACSACESVFSLAIDGQLALLVTLLCRSFFVEQAGKEEQGTLWETKSVSLTTELL